MAALLALLLLTQAQTGGTEPRVGLQLEQGFERYVGDGRLFLNTRLGVDVRPHEDVWLRAELYRVERFGKSGFGTGLLADIRVGDTLRLLPGFSLGDPSVLAVSTAGLGAVYSGLEPWPGFVLTGWLTLYSFQDSRATAVTVGVVQYYGRFWFQYNVRYSQGLNVEVPGLSHALGLGARFDGPVRLELGLNLGLGGDAYLETYVEPMALVDIQGVHANARARLWVLHDAGLQVSVWMGEQWWKSGELAFSRRGVSLGLWTEL